MRGTLCFLLLGGLLAAVHAQTMQEIKLRAKRGLTFGNLKDLFKNKQKQVQQSAGGTQQKAGSTGRSQSSGPDIFAAPPPPPPPPPRPPPPEETFCSPGWTKVSSMCVKIFEDEPVTAAEAASKCQHQPTYKGQVASLYKVSGTNSNAPENQYIKNYSNSQGNLWIKTQFHTDNYVINKATGMAAVENAETKLGYVCAAKPGRGRRVRRKKSAHLSGKR